MLPVVMESGIQTPCGSILQPAFVPVVMGSGVQPPCGSIVQPAFVQRRQRKAQALDTGSTTASETPAFGRGLSLCRASPAWIEDARTRLRNTATNTRRIEDRDMEISFRKDSSGAASVAVRAPISGTDVPVPRRKILPIRHLRCKSSGGRT
jgi:hypothetical protein